ncbi:hypothetical protein P9112_012665 [Eukaryota sp. TZLM1-RC]
MQQKKKKDNEATDSVATFPTNLFKKTTTKEQQNSSSRTLQSETVILLYMNKRMAGASISYRNRRSDPSIGREYCTFFSHYVSHDVDATELAMVTITLDVGCCSCLYFVLHCCYFDGFHFVDLFGLSTCTLNIRCFSCLCFALNCCLEYFYDTIVGIASPAADKCGNAEKNTEEM